MLGISLAAFSVPLRARTQKSDGLFVTKASLCFVPVAAPGALVPEGAGWQPDRMNVDSSAQTKTEIRQVDFFSRIGFLGIRFFGCARHVYHKGTRRQSINKSALSVI
jgi:hypothetical protein